MAEGPGPIRISELAYLLDQLHKNKKPTPRLKSAIAKIEQIICDAVETIQMNKDQMQ